MGDMGLGLAYGAAGAADALRQQIMDRLSQAKFDEQKRADLADEDLRRQQITSAAEIKRQAELDRQQANDQQAEVHRAANFDRGLTLTPAGSVIPPEEQADFGRYGMKRLLTTPPLNVDSSAMPDASVPSVSPNIGGTPRITGRLIGIQTPPQNSSLPGNPGDAIFTGTAGNILGQNKVDQAGEIASARAEAAQARQAAVDAYRQSNLDLRDRDVSRREQAYTDRLNPPDDPTLPRGVQDYALQLRQKYGTDLQSAEAELASAWPQIKAAHPHVDATRAVGAVRGMFGAAPGASKTADLLRSAGVDPSLLAGAPANSGGRGAVPGADPTTLRGTLRTMPATGTPPAPNGPKVGEQRVINGQLASWDGRGWKAVPPPPQ